MVIHDTLFICPIPPPFLLKPLCNDVWGSLLLICLLFLCFLGVVPANQTEESEVRELSGKESGTGSGTPFLREFVKVLQTNGGSGTSSGLLPKKVWFAGTTPEK